jgi:hypothetical protein
MVNYTCKSCGFSTILKANFQRHLSTKKHVDQINVSHILAEYSQNTPSQNNYICCKYCNQKYKHQSSLSRHIKYRCKHSHKESIDEMTRLLNEKQEMIDKKDNELETIKKTMLSLEERVNRLTNKIQINKINNTLNNTVNNFHFQINDYKHTSIDHLTKSDYINAINQCNHCIPKIIESIHFNPQYPENMNIYIHSMNNKYIMIREDGKWKIKNRFDGLHDIFDDKYSLLSDWLDDNETDKKTKRWFERFEKNMEDDQKRDFVIENIKLFLYNNRDLPMNNSIVNKMDAGLSE